MIAFAAGLWVSDRWLASRASADGPTTTPTTRSTTRSTTSAATRPALPADVQAVATRFNAAYAKRTLRISGTIETKFDAAGMQESATRKMDALFESPTRYRHEAIGELLLVADGKVSHIYETLSNTYVKKTIDEAAASALQPDARAILAQQNPALLVAITGDAESLFAPAADATVRLLPAGDASVDLVEVTTADKTVTTYTLNHERGTLNKVELNFAGYLTARGATDVKSALATVTFDEPAAAGEPIAAVDPDQFAFHSPAGAREAVTAEDGELMTDAGGDPGDALRGKPAPAVALKDLEGNEVKAVGEGGAAEGNVIVLDFWATWCPPCRAGMPHLAKVAKEFAARGVKVYAVNQQEDAATVKKFLDDGKLDLVALLDVDGAVGKSYRVRGIPQTVIIGRDGTVKKVIVGFDPAHANALDAAVVDALK